MTRRDVLLKIGLAFNGAVGAVLAVPIVRYLLGPVLRGGNDESWLSLGAVDQFPEGQTRLATYRNPVEGPSDGDTAKVACWVRRVEAQKLQVFAINCAHLGCPVRWFPQSALFMCPCHGGIYYADGSRASGPPERGLFEYELKIDKGQLMIKAGRMPTTGSPLIKVSDIKSARPPCA